MGTEVNVNNKGSGGNWVIAILSVLLIFTGLLCYKYYNKAQHQKSVSTELSRSLNSMQDTAKLYKIRWNNGVTTQAAVTQPLYLKKDNAKKLFSADVAVAKKMGAKNEDFNSLSAAGIQTQDSAKHITVYRDSLQSLHSTFNDGWTQAYVTIYRDIERGADWNIQSRDTIYQIDFYRQHHFWFIHWRTKLEQSAITAKNPHSTIRFFRVIKIIQ